MDSRGARRRGRLGLLVLCLPALFALGDAAREPAPPPGRPAGVEDPVEEILADGFWDFVGFPDALDFGGD